jgi:tetratricopeptide (TPR) repeat protein
LLSLSLLVLLAAPARAELPPGWEDTPFLKQVVSRAAGKHRHVLVLVERGFCEGCAEIRRALSSVGRSGAFERSRYDAGAGEGQDVARRYNVVVFPTLLVLGTDAVERGRITGPMPAAELGRRVKAIRAGRGTLDKLDKLAAKRPDDLKLALRVGTGWAHRGERAPAERHLRRVIEGDADNRRGLAAPALWALGDLLFERSLGSHADAERELGTLVKRFPDTPEAKRALLGLALAMARGRQARAAMALLKKQATDADGHARLARFTLELATQQALGLEHARKATKLAPKRASLWELQARLLQRLGEHKKAREAWKRAGSIERRGSGQPRVLR